MSLDQLYDAVFDDWCLQGEGTIPSNIEGHKDQLLTHYTSAEVFFSLVDNNAFWLRNTKLMNDSSEVEFALSFLPKLFREGKIFQTIVNQLVVRYSSVTKANTNNIKNMCYSIVDTVLAEESRLQKESYTYITCFSEHSDGEKNEGRLSMWRGYGKGTVPVSIDFKLGTMASDLRLLKVIYCEPNKVFNFLEVILNKILQNFDCLFDGFLTAQPATSPNVTHAIAVFVTAIVEVLAVSCVFIKHSGFKEEQEWRLALIHPIAKEEQDSTKVGCIVRTPIVKLNQGVPQKIYTASASDLVGMPARIVDLIDSLIIGPCSHNEVVLNAIQSKFISLGKDKEFVTKNIKSSGIPLRV